MKKTPTPFYTSLDLELNQNKDTGPRIIQMGTCVGNLLTGEIVDRLSIFVNPLQELEPFIIQLTKIKQSDVDSGVSLEEAYRQLEIIHKKYGSFVNPLVWGSGDVWALSQELKQHNPMFKEMLFGRRTIDAKTLYISYRIANNQFPTGGLSRACANLKIKWVGRAHNALDDSINTFNIYRYLIQYFQGDRT